MRTIKRIFINIIIVSIGLYIIYISQQKVLAQTTPFPTYPPLPTGYAQVCTLAQQTVNLPPSCVRCILRYRPDIRITYDSAGFRECTDNHVVDHFCNGGLSSQARSDCNALRLAPCRYAPDNCPPPWYVPPTPAGPSPTPPAPVNTFYNQRGCGILYTAGVPSCWCNNGGGQGLCGNLPLDGPGGCRDKCENGTFVGQPGYTHCFMMENGQECRSNDDGSYRFCLNQCIEGNPGYIQSVGCQYPNKTIFGQPAYDLACVQALNQSSNLSIVQTLEKWFKQLISSIDQQNFIGNLVRVPGVQKATCDPEKGMCNTPY